MPGFSKSLEFGGDGRIQDIRTLVFTGFYDSDPDGEDVSVVAICPKLAADELVQFPASDVLHIDSFGRYEAPPDTGYLVDEQDLIANGLRVIDRPQLHG